MIYLKQLDGKEEKDIYNLLQSIGACENEFKNSAFGLSYNEFQNWLIEQDKWSRGQGLPEGYVAQTIFWLFDDDIPVAIGKVRHKLTNKSKEIGGNVGYAVGSQYRGKGYATVLLKLLLDKAREMGIEEILLTVEKYNPASKKVIEKVGGRLTRETNERWYFVF